MHSSAMAELLGPQNKPKPAVNHMKKNLQNLREKEQEQQRKVEEQSRMPNEPFKMKKFSNVQSKLR